MESYDRSRIVPISPEETNKIYHTKLSWTFPFGNWVIKAMFYVGKMLYKHLACVMRKDPIQADFDEITESLLKPLVNSKGTSTIILSLPDTSY